MMMMRLLLNLAILAVLLAGVIVLALGLMQMLGWL
jgi:hypothetical protein